MSEEGHDRAIRAVAAAVATQEAIPGTDEWDAAYEKAMADTRRTMQSRYAEDQASIG